MSNYYVYLGAVGWQHAFWLGDFYPDELPEDWQLPFYNSQFRCVYLPYEMWRSATDEQVVAWLNETKAGFRFLLQEPDRIDAEAVRLAERFGKRGIFETEINLMWLEGKPDLRNIAQWMQQASISALPLYLVSRNGELTQLRQVNELMEILGV